MKKSKMRRIPSTMTARMPKVWRLAVVRRLLRSKPRVLRLFSATAAAAVAAVVVAGIVSAVGRGGKGLEAIVGG